MAGATIALGVGVEADASWMDSDGDITCFAASPKIVTSTCRVRPQSTGTLTGRVGYSFGPGGRSLIYAKGGLGWVHDDIDMALNAAEFGLVRAIALATVNNQDATMWGGTVGVEHQLTPVPICTSVIPISTQMES
jgi:hypothetical protein